MSFYGVHGKNPFTTDAVPVLVPIARATECVCGDNCWGRAPLVVTDTRSAQLRREMALELTSAVDAELRRVFVDGAAPTGSTVEFCCKAVLVPESERAEVRVVAAVSNVAWSGARARSVLPAQDMVNLMSDEVFDFVASCVRPAASVEVCCKAGVVRGKVRAVIVDGGCRGEEWTAAQTLEVDPKTMMPAIPVWYPGPMDVCIVCAAPVCAAPGHAGGGSAGAGDVSGGDGGDGGGGGSEPASHCCATCGTPYCSEKCKQEDWEAWHSIVCELVAQGCPRDGSMGTGPFNGLSLGGITKDDVVLGVQVVPAQVLKSPEMAVRPCDARLHALRENLLRARRGVAFEFDAAPAGPRDVAIIEEYVRRGEVPPVDLFGSCFGRVVTLKHVAKGIYLACTSAYIALSHPARLLWDMIANFLHECKWGPKLADLRDAVKAHNPAVFSDLVILARIGGHVVAMVTMPVQALQGPLCDAYESGVVRVVVAE
jgi:hypothetical protein